MILEYFWSQPIDIGASNIRLVISGLFFGQFCRLEEVRILNGLIKNMIVFYYMEESVLLGTKPLVDSIRHFIRDPSGVFSVCHLCECRIVQ